MKTSDRTFHILLYPLIYDASGYLIGTSHHVVIKDGEFKSSGMLSQHITKILTDEQNDNLCRIVEQSLPAFHTPTKRDRSQGGDMGSARFIYKGLYADPDDVPELSQFLLSIDPSLSSSPGGLQ